MDNDGLTDEMMTLASRAEDKYGDGYTVLLEPNIGDSSSRIYSYFAGKLTELYGNQADSDSVESEAMQGMDGIIIISSHWSDAEQEFIVSEAKIDNNME